MDQPAAIPVEEVPTSWKSIGTTKPIVEDSIGGTGFIRGLQGQCPYTPDHYVSKKNVSRDVCEYEEYPLLQSLIRYEETRNNALNEEGKLQMMYPKSNDGWLKTVFIVQGRALDWILLPWIIVSLHATLYTVLHQVSSIDMELERVDEWQTFFAFVMNSTLAFLLVFRLNRAATRYWIAREFWGRIVANVRTLTSVLLVHGEHNPVQRDEAIRWLLATTLAIMHHLRGEVAYPRDQFAGILSEAEVHVLEIQAHPPIYACHRVRLHLKRALTIKDDTPITLANMWAQQLDRMEQLLNQITDSCGGMERIRGTPLPMVYVAHLRTFLLLNLLMSPYIWGSVWGWGTIPIVAVAGFALLGIEAGAAEAEIPFRKERVNALDMDSFCKGCLGNALQLMSNHADILIDSSDPRLTRIRKDELTAPEQAV